jgi:hypothetical protein
MKPALKHLGLLPEFCMKNYPTISLFFMQGSGINTIEVKFKIEKMFRSIWIEEPFNRFSSLKLYRPPRGRCLPPGMLGKIAAFRQPIWYGNTSDTGSICRCQTPGRVFYDNTIPRPEIVLIDGG